LRKRIWASAICALLLSAQPLAAQNHQHDFDFEFGAWKAQVSRLVHPLSGSHTWVDYDGTSVVRKIWGGRANLGELEVDGAGGHLEGLTLRLYDPHTQLWSIRFSNGIDGKLSVASVGRFENGRGEFFDREIINGRSVSVRFVFLDVTPASFHVEQSFSPDGGKTWEKNWIATFTR
jgi:hypothetical protein